MPKIWKYLRDAPAPAKPQMRATAPEARWITLWTGPTMKMPKSIPFGAREGTKPPIPAMMKKRPKRIAAGLSIETTPFLSVKLETAVVAGLVVRN